ncbi:MAG: maleylacetoacetate isomerase [Pseudomonadota bacterium]
MKLYAYWRSSASYRVRIALNLKNISHEIVSLNIVGETTGQQFSPEFKTLNPQSRVPLLVDGDFKLNQSLAMLEYLEARHPKPALVPADAKTRARMWAFCHTIAGDIQPLQNLGPLAYLTREFKATDEQKNVWLRHWIERGLSALETELHDGPQTAYVFGEAPTLAECVLVPQIYAARRFKCDESKFSRLASIADCCNQLPAFDKARPENQPDAPKA